MAQPKLPEVWQRGPVAGVPALLQPVAHALLQAAEEVEELMQGFPERLLWEKPANVASPGFHLQHLTGVLNRLFTYARAEKLNADQLHYLQAEGKPYQEAGIVDKLTQQFKDEVEAAIKQLRNTDAITLTEHRGIGRAQLPTTVIGLLVHAAEHTTRHVGQLLVTVKILVG